MSRQLSGLDAMFLYSERPSQPQHIGGLGIYDQSDFADEPLRFKQILDHVRSRLHLSEGFRNKLSRVYMDLGRPYWVTDPDFDVEYHVRHIALTQPQDWRQLMIDVSRLHARPIDLTRPPWELWIIEGLDNLPGISPGSFGVLFKLHHCAVDGISAWEMVDALHDHEALAPSSGTLAKFETEEGPSQPKMLASAVKSVAVSPVRIAKTLYQTLPIVRETLYRGARDMPLFSGRAPATRLNGKVGPHRVHDSRTFTLADIREIRTLERGSTVNDVVVSIVGGALRKYLEAHGELPEASLIAGCPISIRAEADQGAAGNQAIFAMVDLGTNVKDPVERLRQVREITSAKKEFTHAVPAGVLTDYAQYVPGNLTKLATTTYSKAALANRHRPLYNTIVTNVPGSREPLYFAGARMVHYDAWGPVWDGLGIIHPITSYCGQITVSFDADRDQMPDPALYIQCIQESFDELLAAARGE